MSILNIFNKLAKVFNKSGSSAVEDQTIIKSFISDPDFPWLISFSRTGSHWLRMLMELYFEKPSLVRIFFFKDAKDFTCYHRHDMDLKIEGVRNVIYLYRNPVDTVYSQLSYYKEGTDNRERMRYWSELYGRHLSKWLFREKFTLRKTVITYEGLKSDLHKEFRKICGHFSADFNPQKLTMAAQLVSKEDLKKKTKHDAQVVNLSESYEASREQFRNEFGGYVMEVVCSQNESLKGLF